MNAPLRNSSGQLTGDWADKAEFILRSRPLRRQRWLWRAVFVTGCAAGLVVAVALGFFSRWHDDQRLELGRQRHSVEAFVHSPEFARFGEALDRQLLATINFAVARPKEAQARLPAVAGHEKTRRQLPWMLEVMPLPTSAGVDPVRVARAVDQVDGLLARRGHRVDDAARAAARQLFLRTLAPYAQEFLRRAPDRGFPAFFLDRSMQEAALAAYAGRAGGGATVAERRLDFYAQVGPAMWQAVESDAAARKPAVFAGFRR